MVQFTFHPIEDREDCWVTAYLQSEEKLNNSAENPFPAVIICPGGAYQHVSTRESEPVAKKYFAAGYHAFVLNYTVEGKAKNFQPLLQLAAAIATVRRKAKEWMVDTNRIAVCGFSAGGHLAASLGTLFDDEKFLSVCPERGNIRPDAMILGYPVITADELTHEETLYNVSGGAAKGSDEYLYFGLDRHVDENTPVTFLWHTAADTCVPVENSLRFAAALSAAKVPFELHIFPEGDHGMSVCTREVEADNPYNARWVEWSIEWLKRVLK